MDDITGATWTTYSSDPGGVYGTFHGPRGMWIDFLGNIYVADHGNHRVVRIDHQTLAWQAFGQKNGAATEEEMRTRVERYRRVAPNPSEDYDIGCILLQKPFFFDRGDWIPIPEWKPNIGRSRPARLPWPGRGRRMPAARHPVKRPARKWCRHDL